MNVGSAVAVLSLQLIYTSGLSSYLIVECDVLGPATNTNLSNELIYIYFFDDPII